MTLIPPKKPRFNMTTITEKLKQWLDKAKLAWDNLKAADKLKSVDKSALTNKFKFKQSKKGLIIIVAVVVLILLGIWAKHMYDKHQMLSKAANQVIAKASAMADIQQEIGSAIKLHGSLSGSVSNDANDADLSFAVTGTKNSGQLKATLQNGQLVTLSLINAQDQSFDVLQDQAKIEKAAALKLAEEKKQQQMSDNFKAAIQAYDEKDFSKSLLGFQQSINDQYEIANSYEYIGFIYSQTGEYQKCVDALHQFLDLQSDNKEGYYQLAYCYLQVYDTANALSNLQASCNLGYQPACDAVTKINAQQAANAGAQPTNSTEQPGSAPTVGATPPSGTPAETVTMPSSPPTTATPPTTTTQPVQSVSPTEGEQQQPGSNTNQQDGSGEVSLLPMYATPQASSMPASEPQVP